MVSSVDVHLISTPAMWVFERETRWNPPPCGAYQLQGFNSRQQEQVPVLTRLSRNRTHCGSHWAGSVHDVPQQMSYFFAFRKTQSLSCSWACQISTNGTSHSWLVTVTLGSHTHGHPSEETWCESLIW